MQKQINKIRNESAEVTIETKDIWNKWINSIKKYNFPRLNQKRNIKFEQIDQC